MNGPILDGQVVRRLRLSQCLSVRELAVRLGVSSGVVRSLEAGINHSELSLGLVALLASELGSSVHELLRAESDEEAQPPATDDRRLEAALLTVGQLVRPDALGVGFGWELQRVNAAVRALDARLTASGLQVRRSNSAVAVQPRPGVLKATEERAIRRAHLADKGLKPNAAATLRDVAQERVDATWEQGASRDQRVQLATLLKLGLIEPLDDGTYRLHADVEYALAD